VKKAGSAATLESLDPESLQRLRALVEPRPLYLHEGRLRDFRSLEEIQATRRALDGIEAALEP